MNNDNRFIYYLYDDIYDDNDDNYWLVIRLVDEDIRHPFLVAHKIDLKKYAGSAVSISPDCDKADADRTASISPNSVCKRRYLSDGVENCSAIRMDGKNYPPEIISTNNNTVTISAVTIIMIF
ncbi:hypothetical protein HCN44_004826 [Aphidius gifuensis]|uniref:Uncharacterized protein n=1 Tax=Aphidius gifuensis TaxID=684658 RepID=A0A834XVQ5_APHGI|nr:hypothetical protein HCN44_004826 [Aphidius gifuensis]